MIYQNIGEHLIKSKSNFGANIILDDGSSWEVASSYDRIQSSLWLILDSVTVIHLQGRKFKMVHRSTSGKTEEIEASYLN